MMATVTPLKKHPGHPGLLALLVVIVAGVIVWLDVRNQPAPPPADETSYSIAPKLPASQSWATPGASVQPSPPPLATIVEPPSVRERFVTATGFVTLEEAKTHRVVAAQSGLLVKTRRSRLGTTVRLGEVLGTIYSAEVYTTTEQLLDALAKVAPQREIDGLRYRLMGWGMPMQTITQIERARTPSSALPVVARVAGRVIGEERRWWPMLRAGQTELFTITDPGHYTVFVELPDVDAARTEIGMPAQLTLEGVARPVTAKVAHVWRRSVGGKRTVRFDLYLPRTRLVDNLAVNARFDFGL